ncbi:MAG TPA: ABC transporter substrate-binding protein [Glaciihabitans sp.]|jgi:peptide/nickel transport system substrate-binding protein|nr:ABC transporter substrate-binding protein [Glaciihabitans sp.]
MSRSATSLALATLTVSALMLTACSSASTESGGSSDPVVGGTLTYASGDAEPSCLDPHVGGNYPQALVSTQYLEALVSLDKDGAVIPWLASSWAEAEDGLSWEFTLRDDVTFTDGTPFDAAAVKTNIEHVLDPATGSSTGYLAVGKVASVDVVSDTVVRLNLSSPDSALLESLSQPWVAIQSPTAIARGKDVNCESPVGTGPFIVTAWDRQNSVTLERNDNYVSPPADVPDGDYPYLDAIEWRFVPDAATRYAALASGDVDVIDNAQPDAIVSAEQDDSIAELDSPRPGASNRIEFNSDTGPFADVRVREAFIRSAGVDDAVSSLYFGTAERSYSALSSVEPLGTSAPELFEYDADAAAALLDEAGWTTIDSEGYRTKDGERLTVNFPISTNQSIPAEQSVFEQIQATTKEVGFEVVLEPLDLSSWYEVLGANEYDLVSAPYTKVGPDVLRILFESSGTIPAPSGYFANHAKVTIPELDALLISASEISDPDERARLYSEAQQIILEGYYILPLYDQQNHYLYQNDVKGLRTIPTVSTPTFTEAWLDR